MDSPRPTGSSTSRWPPAPPGAGPGWRGAVAAQAWKHIAWARRVFVAAIVAITASSWSPAGRCRRSPAAPATAAPRSGACGGSGDGKDRQGPAKTPSPAPSPATGPATSHRGHHAEPTDVPTDQPPPPGPRPTESSHASPLRHPSVTPRLHRERPRVGRVGSVQCRSARFIPSPAPRGGVPGPRSSRPVAPGRRQQVAPVTSPRTRSSGSRSRTARSSPLISAPVARRSRCGARTPASS